MLLQRSLGSLACVGLAFTLALTGACGGDGGGDAASTTSAVSNDESRIETATLTVTPLVTPHGSVQNYRFNEPHWPIYDTLPCYNAPCQIIMGSDPSWNIDIYKFRRIPDAPSHIVRIGDDLAIDVSQVHCVGACDNVETYNWEEATNNTGFDLKFWPNPSHPRSNCRNDFECFKRGNPWNEDCWDHRNVDSFYQPTHFPTIITHHEFVTYNLDFTCRTALRDCQYQINADWSVQFLRCYERAPFYGSSCDSNVWQSCQ